MIIFATIIALLVIGQLLCVGTGEYDDRRFVGRMTQMLGGILLLLSLIGLIFHPLSVRSDLEEIKAVRSTVEVARADGETLEDAALQQKVADYNADLASYKYWNGTIMDWWIPDQVEQVKPIR